ncbi:hypothetical protein [Acidiphilium angustum]|uniref:hypothetical protein n=1 Tax=Acidiphilium angustum TaxID=523 RepID=UPI000493DC15|nr:hypothetical protein [Acidiphilium angustum]
MATFLELLTAAKATPEGAVQVAMVGGDLQKLDDLYADEGARPAAEIMAAHWTTNGGPLRKAAVKHWAQDKGIVPPDEDKPDPDGKQPPPRGEGDGSPAPRVATKSTAPAAPGDQGAAQPAGNAAHDQRQAAHHDPKHAKHHPAIHRLRALTGKTSQVAAMGAQAAAGDPEAIAAMAYQAGAADAAQRHAHAVHHAARRATRHAFQLGMMGAQSAKGGQADANKSAPTGELAKSELSQSAFAFGGALMRAGAKGAQRGSRLFSSAVNKATAGDGGSSHTAKRTMRAALYGAAAATGAHVAGRAWSLSGPYEPRGMSAQAQPVNFGPR